MPDRRGPGPILVDPADAAELVEMLAFLGEWLDSPDRPELSGSLRRFTSGGYSLTELQADLARVAFLLLGDDGDRLFGPSPPQGTRGPPRHPPRGPRTGLLPRPSIAIARRASINASLPRRQWSSGLSPCGTINAALRSQPAHPAARAKPLVARRCRCRASGA